MRARGAVAAVALLALLAGWASAALAVPPQYPGTGVGALWVEKFGDYSMTYKGGDASGMSAADAYLSPTGLGILGPGTESLVLPGYRPGVCWIWQRYDAYRIVGTPFEAWPAGALRLRADSTGVAITGKATVSDSLNVAGRAVVGDSLRVEGAALLQGKAVVDDSLTVHGRGAFGDTLRSNVAVRTSGWVSTPRLGPASGPTSGGAIRFVDGVAFPLTGAGVQAAVNDLPARGGRVIVPADSIPFGTDTLYIGKNYVSLEGAGGRATVFTYSGTGRFITLGANDGNHAGATEAYNGTASGCRIVGIRLVGPGKTSTATAITDWDSGSNEYYDLTIQAWGVGYFGIGADVSLFRKCYIQGNGVGVHLGSRSDQTQFDDCYWAQNKFGLRDEYAYNARIVGGQFVFSDSADVLCDAPASATQGGDIRTQVGLWIGGTWFESSTATVGWPIDRHIWFGKDGTSGRRIEGLMVEGAYVYASTSQHFLQVDGATNATIRGVHQIGTMNAAPVNISSVSGVFPNVTTSANFWSGVSALFDGAGYGNVQEYAQATRQINAVAYAASITPSGSTGGELVQVSSLTGDLTVNAPSNSTKGKFLNFAFQQDGTGGRAITWNSAFKHSWSDVGNVANARASVTFYCYDGTNWQQVGRQQGWNSALGVPTFAVVSDSLRTNKGLYVGGQFVNKILRASASLDFDLSAVNCQDLTVTVTGAAVGDEVFVGAPNGSIVTDETFSAWVSAANTVTVRACDGAGAGNPASGTYKVTVFQ